MLAPLQDHKLMEGESSLLPIIGEATQIDIKLGIHVSDILWTQKGILEEKERIFPVLDLIKWFVMHPNCSPPKDIIQNIPQKIHVNYKVLVERDIIDLLHLGTRSF